MYLQFFGLREAPFSITPDPAFVFLSAAHRDALAHLLYGVGKGGAGGFVQLTGEVGTGKTTICRCLLEQVPPDTIIALILNPMMTPKELLAAICEELGVSIEGFRDSSKELVDALNACLLEHHAHGRRVVVVIDEAQNLSPDAMEQVRLLTNLETAKDKLLQMVLLGQPELRQLLQRQDLRQLAQRITARYHLAPLGEKETVDYVRHRMQVAGAQRNPFNRAAMRALFQRSGGVPRLINIIADRALAGAYAAEQDTVTARMVNAAASEVQPSEVRVRKSRWPELSALAAVLALLAVSVVMWGMPGQQQTGLIAEPEQVAVQVQPAVTAVEPPSPTPASATGLPAHALEEAVVVPQDSASMTELSASELLTETWLSAQNGMAWQGLADLWQDGKKANAIQAACDGQPKTGYACINEQGSWGKIQRLGIPVILVLQSDTRQQVLLQGMNGQEIWLGASDAPLKLDRGALEQSWFGEYLVAWPQAPDWPIQIRRGQSGAAVNIVMQMASQASPPWSGSGVFDAGFEAWLFDFQRRQGLIPDGIVGPQTLLYLMAPTIAEPRLSAIREKGF